MSSNVVATGCFRTRDGLQLATLRWPGRGRPLYLMHATSLCAATWDPIARRLAPRLEPRAMDERGHGESDKPDAEYPWNLFAEDLLDWLEHEGTSDALALGHSCGATAVILAAAESSERFERILLVDPVLVAPLYLVERSAKRRPVWPSRAAAREALGGRFPYSGFDPDVLELYLEHGLASEPDGSVSLRCPREIEARIYRGFLAADPWPQLGKVRARTRIVLPEHSGTPTELQARLAAEMPGVEIVRVPGTHFVCLERPALIAEQALEFFD